MIRLEKASLKIKDKTILNPVSCQFEIGKMHLILGPNGAGKSTLIKLMSRETTPSSGKIYLNEKDLKQYSPLQLAKFRAVLSQNIELSFPMLTNQVVMMGRYPHFGNKPTAQDTQICEQAMQLFDVFTLSNRNYQTLSGGEKQRVQFARVFAQIWQTQTEQPRLLLLDEPLTFLDIYYQYSLMQKMKDFMQQNPDLTVIGVVHDLSIATKFAHQTLLVKNSSIFAQGNPDAVLSKNNILEVFGVKIKQYLELE